VDLAVNASSTKGKKHDVIRTLSHEINRALIFPTCYIFTSFNVGYRMKTLAVQAGQVHGGL